MAITIDTSSLENVRAGLIQVKDILDTLETDINADILSGTYTPTLFNTTNVASSTAFTCQYIKVFNVVTVSGRVDIDPTTTAATLLGMSIPIASNFAASNNAGGTFSSPDSIEHGSISADATNDRVSFQYTAANSGGRALLFSFTYVII